MENKVPEHRRDLYSVGPEHFSHAVRDSETAEAIIAGLEHILSDPGEPLDDLGRENRKEPSAHR